MDSSVVERSCSGPREKVEGISDRVQGDLQVVYGPRVRRVYVAQFNHYIWVVVKIMVPFLGTLNIRCRTIIGIQKGTIILTTTHMDRARG